MTPSLLFYKKKAGSCHKPPNPSLIIMEPTDYLKRYQADDDEKSLEKFCKIYFPGAIGWLRKKGWSKEDSSDIVAEALLRLLKILQSGQQIRKEGAYFIDIVWKVSSEWVRRQKKERALFIESLANTGTDSIDDKILKELMLTCMYNVLEKTPQQDQEIIRMLLGEEMTAKEVAQLFNISYEAVRQRISRFYERVRKNCANSLNQY